MSVQSFRLKKEIAENNYYYTNVYQLEIEAR